MYWVVDILLIAFIGVLLYRGIKKGFLNTSFTLVTWIINLGLAAGCTFALIYFVFTPLGWVQDVQVSMLGVIGGDNSLFGTFNLKAADVALYLSYGILGLVLIIPLYIFFLWVGKQFERFVAFLRRKCLAVKIIGSVIGGAVNLAIASAIVLGFFWVVASVQGSGLFVHTTEALRAAPVAGLIYDNNPLYMILGKEGSLADTIRPILEGTF